MTYQRVQKSSFWKPEQQNTRSRFAPRPFSVQPKQQESNGTPTAQEIENQAYEQHSNEVTGLEMEEKAGTIV